MGTMLLVYVSIHFRDILGVTCVWQSIQAILNTSLAIVIAQLSNVLQASVTVKIVQKEVDA